MITKLASSLDMSFKVPDSEKKIGQEAIKNFFSVINSISLMKDHLDILYDPFKKAQEISTDALFKFRGKLNRFRSKVKENFKILKKNSFKSLENLNYFSKDTHCIELINAFKESVSDLMNAGIKFIEILDDFKVSDFKDKVIAAIDNIKKEAAQTEELVRERVIDHIRQNIIGESWVSEEGASNILKERIPTVIEIYKNINKTDESMPQIQKRPQSLNVSDSQRIFYPQDMRAADQKN